LSVVSCHALTKRSLLGGDPNGHAHGHKHQEHAKGQVHGEQQSNGQRVSGRRGREEADQAPEGYLPPSDDYQEDSLGGNQGQGQYGDSEYDYEYDDHQGQYGEQSQYDNEGSEEGAQETYGHSQNYPDYYDEEPLPAGKIVDEEEYESEDYYDEFFPAGKIVEDEESETDDNVAEENSAIESYGAPADDTESEIDSSTSDLVENDDQYNSPISDATNFDSDEYSSPNNRHDTVSQRRNRNKPGSSSRGNGFPFTNIAGRPAGGRKAEGNNSKDNNADEGIKEQECPGGSIEECVKVCPGTTLRVYGACVNGCAERCSR